MSIRNKIALGAMACVLGTAIVGMSMPARAGDAGAFLGGVFAAKVVSNMSDRTEAEQQQAAAATAAAQRPVPAAPAQKSPQERIQELDKLAAGGYISKEEYKTKKQQILDDM